MNMKHKLEKKYINNIAVIGGGRWARLIIDSLVQPIKRYKNKLPQI